MKRTVLLTATLAIALLTAASMVMAQPPTPSVPNLINFQGRLTDNVGNPVADGAHTVDFYIFPVRTGGVSVWNESQTPTTTGGLFTTQLGLNTPLPLTLFEDYDSLFLEIVADAQLISPRTLLSSTPSTRVTNAIEHRNSISGVVDLKNFDGGHGIITYGGDGLDQTWLYGYSWGELFLFDSDPSNDLTVRLSADNTVGGPNGGQLELRGGPSYFNLNAGNVGDASALLPTDAVNSFEILDEPGVSNSDNLAFFPLSGGSGTSHVVDSVDITIPAAGYVEVTCNAFMNLNHTSGSNSSFYTSISKTRADVGLYAGTAVARVPGAIATTSLWAFPMSASRLFAEVSPGTYRYYLNVIHESGTNTTSNFDFSSFRAKYFPTLYGSVTLARAVAEGNSTSANTTGNTAQALPNVEVATITVADHNARLEAERAKQMAELVARVKQLEEQVKSGQYPNLAPGTPRKER
jgi:hypothetical protein